MQARPTCSKTGFNHFFHAKTATHGSDLVFFQPHSAPGVYARAFLEGRLEESDLSHFRRELAAPAAGARGLCSYPHPYRMPDFWQFPTGSMGIGPISSIYHARFMRVRAFAHTVDGQMQTFAAKDGRYNRDTFFGQDPELARLAPGHDGRSEYRHLSIRRLVSGAVPVRFAKRGLPNSRAGTTGCGRP